MVVGCDVHGSVGQAEAAAEIVRKTLVPADQESVEAWLAELSVIVPRRQDDEFTETLRLEAYASRLRQYPADVAHHAVLGETWKFWPSWNELEAVCKRLVAPRKHMLKALENPASPEKPQPEDRVTADRAADILEQAGFTPKRFNMAKNNRMATTFDDLERDKTEERVPHWTETVDPNGPEMEELRKARDANPLVREARESAARHAAKGRAAE